MEDCRPVRYHPDPLNRKGQATAMDREPHQEIFLQTLTSKEKKLLTNDEGQLTACGHFGVNHILHG